MGGNLEAMSANAHAAPRFAWGDGLATRSSNGTVLDTWFPRPALGSIPAGHDMRTGTPELADAAGVDERRGVQTKVVTLQIDLDQPPESTSDAYLRLHLLSHLMVLPNTINLDGIFGLLPNVVWTSAGAVHPDDFADLRVSLQRAGIQVCSIDRFPRLTDFVIPRDVRIADASRVRLGAYLSPGTVVMHEGFCNFNAGTLGKAMIEGRISQGVVVGDGSDVGGGASIMGTLSGGGTQRVSIGERCLLGANAGLGIAIGDDCTVEAGLYITAGTKVTLVDGGSVRQVKALELSGAHGLLFRRNSVSGAVEVISRTGAGIALNSALH
ncbi:MAG: 2,3,4,5-tetrahydropyridine-2,6-dicarboxylate N-succinyltransferase [Actinobacteria bacterium]|uniref:Unannotated protein n=1 Tax=freshwater metagenome TaxID=449393 RepID=A0A6J7FQR0_9ZZZZ|nr:2,3,4,5-tetrahydropyridine-2,6-dicarboxylate N-succinyltransferase [Actinomycetota bacterium]